MDHSVHGGLPISSRLQVGSNANRMIRKDARPRRSIENQGREVASPDAEVLHLVVILDPRERRGNMLVEANLPLEPKHSLFVIDFGEFG